MGQVYLRRHVEGSLHKFWTGRGWSEVFDERMVMEDDHETIAFHAQRILEVDGSLSEDDEISIDADSDINHFLHGSGQQGFIEIELAASINDRSSAYPQVILSSDLGVAWIFKLTTGDGPPRAALVEFHNGDYARTIDLGTASMA